VNHALSSSCLILSFLGAHNDRPGDPDGVDLLLDVQNDTLVEDVVVLEVLVAPEAVSQDLISLQRQSPKGSLLQIPPPPHSHRQWTGEAT